MFLPFMAKPITLMGETQPIMAWLFVVVWPWCWPEGSHIGPRSKAIMATLRQITRPYHYKHSFTYILSNFNVRNVLLQLNRQLYEPKVVLCLVWQNLLILSKYLNGNK